MLSRARKQSGLAPFVFIHFTVAAFNAPRRHGGTGEFQELPGKAGV
jgi:hypothetical protein